MSGGLQVVRQAFKLCDITPAREGVEDTKLPLRERDLSPFTSPTNKLKFVVSTSTSCRSDDQTFRSQISSVCNHTQCESRSFCDGLTGALGQAFKLTDMLCRLCHLL